MPKSALDPLPVLLIVAALAAAHMDSSLTVLAVEPRFAFAPSARADARGVSPGVDVELFACGFEADWDVNYDDWPDRWVRQLGPGYPHYVKMRMVEQPSFEGRRCLRVDLDGGAAAAFSPPVEVSNAFAYRLTGRVLASGLVHDEAYFSVTVVDERGQPVRRHGSAAVRETNGQWVELSVGPLVPPLESDGSLLIGVHVQPQDGMDLRGTVYFDDIRLVRQPQLRISTSAPRGYYTDPADVRIACELSGYLPDDRQVEFTLEDVHGRVLAVESLTLPALDRPGGPRDGDDSLLPDAREPRDSEYRPTDGTTASRAYVEWTPTLPGFGFYRARARVAGHGDTSYEQVASLVVLRPSTVPPGSIFGWTMPHGEGPLELAELSHLAGHVGLGWLKFPLSAPVDDDARAEQLAWFIERMAAQQIHLVGLLEDPRTAVSAEAHRRAAANTFSQPPEDWYPALEPTLLRMSMKVRRWQLGDDHDTSFVGYWGLPERLTQIHRQLDQVGRELRLGLAWNWLVPPPARTAEPSYRFLTLSASPPLSAQELAAYLDAIPADGAETWVSLAPLSRHEYTLEERALDLVQRMVTAQMHGASAVVVPDPLDPERALLTADGRPDELLLPWRTTCLALAGAQHVGELALPGGSPNHVFVRDTTATMLVWNSQPTRETLYLGENIKVVDLWGGELQPASGPDGQTIEVGPLPVFVTGMPAAVAAWQIDCRWLHERLPAVAAKGNRQALRLTNHFAQAVQGTVRVAAPPGWQLTPSSFAVELAPGEVREQPLEIRLPFDVESGPQPLNIVCDIQADRPYHLSVLRPIEVGLEDVHLDYNTRRTSDDRLIVEIMLENTGPRSTTFNCDVYAPERRRQRVQLACTPYSQVTGWVAIDHADDLVDQLLWIRAEELGERRVLNRRFRYRP